MNREQLTEFQALGGKEWEDVLRIHPIGRLGEPQYVTGAVVFLASVAAS